MGVGEARSSINSYQESPRFLLTQRPKSSLNSITYTLPEHWHATNEHMEKEIKKTGMIGSCKMAGESRYHPTTVQITEKVMHSAFSMAVRPLPVFLVVITYSFMSSHFRPHRKMAETIINSEVTAHEEFL